MNFILQLALLAVLCVVVRCQTTVTCSSCDTTYSAAKIASGVTNVEKCTAAKEQLKCLYQAYDTDADAAGCNNVVTMVTTTENDMNTLVQQGTQCVLTDTCTCQKTYLKAQKISEYEKCGAAAGLVSCVTTASQASCDSTITNAVFTTNVKESYSRVCGGSSRLSQVTMFVFILSIIGYLMAKQ